MVTTLCIRSFADAQDDNVAAAARMTRAASFGMTRAASFRMKERYSVPVSGE